MSIRLQPFSHHHQEAVVEMHRAIFPEYHDGSALWRPGQQFDDPSEAIVNFLYIEKSREQGDKVLYSNSANPALLAINKKLGYQLWHAEVRFVKRFRKWDQKGVEK